MNRDWPKTLIIGGANLDIAGSCSGRLIPGDSNPGIVKSSAGGVGRNIAENLARLGFDCTLLTAVGGDIGRSIIIDSCASAGVNTDHIIEFTDASTGSYLAINNQLGALLAAIADMSVIDRITPEALKQKRSLLSDHNQIVAEANLTPEALQWIAANKGPLPLYVDAVSATKAPKIKHILTDIEVLKVNRAEAAAILELQGDDEFLARALYERGVGTVLLSQGPQGALVYSDQGVQHKAAIKGVNASDTGAGDALFAGFIAARELFEKTTDQLEFAIACATFTLNSRSSVNPELSVAVIREQYLAHIAKEHWPYQP